MSVNKVYLLGNLDGEVNIRNLPDGRPVGNVTLTTTEEWRDRDGNKQKSTESHRLNLIGRQAEIASDYLRKGSQIFVEGSLHTRKWTDNEGNERQITEVRVFRFTMLGSRGDRDRSGDGYGSRGGRGGGDGWGNDNRSQQDRVPVRQDGPSDRGRGGGGQPSPTTEEDIPW